MISSAIAKDVGPHLKRDDFSSNRHLALSHWWSMIFFRKPVSTFRDHALSFSRDLLEQLHGGIRVGRPWPEAIEREPGLLAGLGVDEDVIVLLLRRLTLPIEIRRIVGRHLDAGAARQDRILLGAAAAHHQVFHAVD